MGAKTWGEAEEKGPRDASFLTRRRGCLQQERTGRQEPGTAGAIRLQKQLKGRKRDHPNVIEKLYLSFV